MNLIEKQRKLVEIGCSREQAEEYAKFFDTDSVNELEKLVSIVSKLSSEEVSFFLERENKRLEITRKYFEIRGFLFDILKMSYYNILLTIKKKIRNFVLLTTK